MPHMTTATKARVKALLSVASAATAIAVTPATIRTWILNGLLTAAVTGDGRVLLDARDCLTLAKEREGQKTRPARRRPVVCRTCEERAAAVVGVGPKG